DRLVRFLNLVGRRRRPVAVGPVSVAGFTARGLGIGLRWPFAEGGGLAFPRPQGLVERGRQTGDLRLQRRDLTLLLLRQVQEFVVGRPRVTHGIGRTPSPRGRQEGAKQVP